MSYIRSMLVCKLQTVCADFRIRAGYARSYGH